MNLIKRLSNVISTLLIICLLSVSFNVRADIAKGMDMMWTQTNPSFGAVNGNYGGQLGGFSMRSPVRSFKIVAYDPPRFAAGCGGIDASFGSFSMISLDNMRNIMRGIMSNAGGYTAKVVLDNLCTRCQGIMTGLHDLTSKINSASKNTCQIGSHLVDAARGATQLGSLWKNDGLSSREAVTAAAKGAFSDFYEANENRFKNGQNANREGNAADDSTIYGNNLMNTLASTGVFGNGSSAAATIDTAPYGGDQGFLELAMNLYGTDINLTGSNATSSSSGGDFAKGSSNRKDKQLAPLWSFDDLVNGAPTGGNLNGYSCADFNVNKADSCQNVAVKQTEYPGTKRYIIGLLAGKQTNMGDSNVLGDSRTSAIAPDSIMAYLSDNSVTLDERQHRFLNALPIETRTALSSVAATGNTALMAMMVDYVAESLGRNMAAELVQAMNKTLSVSYSANVSNGKDIVPMSEVQKAQSDKLERRAEIYLDPESRSRMQRSILNQTNITMKLNGLN